jgi:hypothetical protein
MIRCTELRFTGQLGQRELTAMRKIILLLFIAISTPRSYADGMLPKDVEKFLAKREGCDHMRGEIPAPNQKARLREVQREIRRLCTGTDMQLNNLKKKYASDPGILVTLNAVEPDVEGAKQRRKQRFR